MSPAYSLSDTLDKQRICLALITEHKLLPRSQHFLSPINQTFYAYNTCDNSTDNFGNLNPGHIKGARFFSRAISEISGR